MAFLQKLATHVRQNVDALNITPPFARKKPIKGDIKYITNSLNQPLFLLNPIAREIVQPNSSRYQEIYNTLQNSHVRDQREFTTNIDAASPIFSNGGSLVSPH